MANSPEDYTMGRDCHASGRLSLQHWLLKDQFGLIHPSITRSWSTAEEPRKVADIACGNAIWGVEVAESSVVKDLQVVGFDVSAAQFPPRGNWPLNLTLETADMFKAPAKEFEGVFDLVNIRLIVITLNDGDPRPVIQHCLKLLKPGGFLQWTEIDMASRDGLPAESVYQRMSELVTQAGGPQSYKWLRQLGSIFEDTGFQDVEYASQLPRKSMQKFFNDNYVMAIMEMAKGLDSPDIEEWWKACEKERTEKGVLALWPSVRCIGKKSL